jgi:cell division septation protein DedD
MRVFDISENAKAAGKSIGDLETQLGFLCHELTSYAAVLKTLKTATSVKEASDIVLTQFERPADQSDAVKTKRTGFGQGYFDKYAQVKTETPTKTLYRVQVGAFSVKANADAMLKRVKAAGFTDAFITQTTK